MIQATMIPSLSPWWIICTSFALWSLVIHSRELTLWGHLLAGEIPYAVYLVGAYPICITCILNTLIYPSKDNKGRSIHVLVGRIGMVAGGIGNLSGVTVSFWMGNKVVPFGLIVGITMGSIGQLGLQFYGYKAIRKYQALGQQIDEMENVTKTATVHPASQRPLHQLRQERKDALQDHIMYMIGLFVVGCATPAVVQLSMLVDRSYALGVQVLLGVLLLIVKPFTSSYTSRLDLDNNVEVGDSTERTAPPIQVV
mmetsp:Transcript_7517/g.17218  ORF Transcript_7517/g.17218 Transcript_7517/m.17218 type:complete len:254 (+) Transcript_7517:1333-2094(+)